MRRREEVRAGRQIAEIESHGQAGLEAVDGRGKPMFTHPRTHYRVHAFRTCLREAT